MAYVRVLYLLLTLGVLSFVLGCVRDEPGGSDAARVVLTDDLGRLVPVPARAERLAVLVPAAADLALKVGARPVLVPTLRGGQPGSWAGIAGVVVDHSTGPGLETLIASGPDLVIVNATHAQFIPQIERLTGAPAFAMEIASVADLARHARTLGRLTGREPGGEAAALSYESFAEIRSDTGEPVPVLAVLGTPHSFYAFLPDSYLGDLVRIAGGELVTAGMASHRVFRGLAPVSTEALAGRGAAVILVLFHGSEQAARSMLASDPLWSSMPAVREGRVFLLPDDRFVMRPGVGMEEALDAVRDAVRAGRP